MSDLDRTPILSEAPDGMPVGAPTPCKAQMRRTFSLMALALGLGAAVGQLAPALLVLWFPGYDVQSHTFLTGSLATGLFTLPLMLLVTRGTAKRAPEKHGMGLGGFLGLVCVGYGAMVAGNLVGILVNLLLSPRSATLVSQLATATGFSAELILSFVVLAPVCEELVFRKIMVDRVLPFGEWPAILFSGLCFGLYHGNLTQLFYTTMLGVMLAYVYVRTGKIVYTMLAHACLNFLGGVLPLLIPAAAYGLLALAAAGAVLFFVNVGKIRVERNAVPGVGGAMFGNGGMILFILFSGMMMMLVAVILNHPEWTQGLLQ